MNLIQNQHPVSMGTEDVRHRFIDSSLVKTALMAAFVATLFVGFSLYWNIDNLKQESLKLATAEAESHWNKDASFRRWATRHGGVYVKPNDRTSPNPYLSHLPHRDVETTDGTRLTLMNPAYMMSQMTREFEEMYGVKGRITGKLQLNPANKPDDWEFDVLTQFENGVKLVTEQTVISGQPYLRFMKPMFMTEGCVNCHGILGFKDGDLRGGVSVSIPLAPYFSAATETSRGIGITHGAIWLLAMFAIFLFAHFARARQSERIQLLRQLKHDAVQLEQKNAELEQFAYTVSHDLKSPLVTVGGFLGLLEKDLEAGDIKRVREDIQKIVVATHNMGRLLDDLLELSRVGRTIGEPELFSLSQVTEGVVSRLHGLIEDSGANIESASDMPSVLADKQRISEVMQNLLENAIKFSGEENQPRISVSARERDKYVECRVRDNGIGIDPRYQDKVFGLFDRLDLGIEGTGIGLALVKRIVEAHQGKIWIESDGDGQGTQVCFTLPAAEGEYRKH